MFSGNLAGVYGPDIAGEATNLTTISETEFFNLNSDFNSSKNGTRRRVLGEVNSFNGFRLAARDPYGQLVRSENKAQVVVRLKDVEANDSAKLVAPDYFLPKNGIYNIENLKLVDAAPGKAY
jgi:hypothetical protein